MCSTVNKLGAIFVVILNLDQAETKTKKRAEKSKKVVDDTKPKSAKKLTKKQKQIIDLANETVMPTNYLTIWTEGELNMCCSWLSAQTIIAVDTETMGLNPWKDEIVGISLYSPDTGFYIPLKHKDHEENVEEGKVVGVDAVKCLPKDLVVAKIKPILEDKQKKFILHNAKFDIHILRNWLGIELTPYFDTLVAQALLDENKSKRLKDIAPIYLGVEAETFSSLFGKETFNNIPILQDPETRAGNLAGYYAIKDTELTYRMYEFQLKHLEHPRLAKIKELFYSLEMPFLKIVVEAEARGVKLDEDYLVNKVAVQLHQELEELKQKIKAYMGDINLNSPIQVSEAVYVKLGLPRLNKEKPNSTDKKTLKLLKKYHKVIENLMDYKEKAKLTQAFADKLPQAVVDSRIHASFNSVGTKTGRMSSNNPNLQQIPTKVGGLIRNAFIADEGRLLASLDFSQQELRVLAHVSQDRVLLDAYKNGLDIHSLTANGMFNSKYPDYECNYQDFEYYRNMKDLFLDENGNLDKKRMTTTYVNTLFSEGKINTKDLDELVKQVEKGILAEKTRKDAKVVNFGIIYGMSKYKLADTLEISVDEADSYITAYFDQYPGVKKWMNDQRNQMRNVHYTETMLGRKRRVYAEMTSPEKWMVQRGFRQGINSVIQGSSADMVKVASIKLQPLLEELDAHIVLWIHDEIVFDVPETIGMENLKRIADVMCTALPLDCGLKSDIEVGRKWAQKMREEDIDGLMEDDDEDDE